MKVRKLQEKNNTLENSDFIAKGKNGFCRPPHVEWKSLRIKKRNREDLPQESCFKASVFENPSIFKEQSHISILLVYKILKK